MGLYARTIQPFSNFSITHSPLFMHIEDEGVQNQLSLIWFFLFVIVIEKRVVLEMEREV
jgi:hypothetical protein